MTLISTVLTIVSVTHTNSLTILFLQAWDSVTKRSISTLITIIIVTHSMSLVILFSHTWNNVTELYTALHDYSKQCSGTVQSPPCLHSPRLQIISVNSAEPSMITWNSVPEKYRALRALHSSRLQMLYYCQPSATPLLALHEYRCSTIRSDLSQSFTNTSNESEKQNDFEKWAKILVTFA